MFSMSAQIKAKKMNIKQLRALTKFLLVLVGILAVAVLVLAYLLNKAQAELNAGVIEIADAEGTFTVCIDAGHGGDDTGAIGIYNDYEKDGNLELALKVVANLKAHGVTVVTTRDEDTYVELSDRASIANEADADLFVSLHQNSSSDSTVCGIEAWIYSEGNSKNTAIATGLLEGLATVGVTTNRGVKSGTQASEHSDYQVIRETNMVGVILEVGFMTNTDDTINFEKKMDEYAAVIANEIIEWLNEYCVE